MHDSSLNGGNWAVVTTRKNSQNSQSTFYFNGAILTPKIVNSESRIIKINPM